MRTLIQKLVIIALFVSIYFTNQKLHAQCGAGYTYSAVNWDMHYFSPTNIPTSPVFFAFGKNSMRFAFTGTNTFRGTTTENNAVVGGDFKFIVGSGADTIVFTKEVTNLSFKVHDIDLAQKLVVTAKNAAGTALNVTMARDSGTILTIAGSGSTSASATATNTAVNLSNKGGSATITVAGPVMTCILTFTKTSGATTDSVYISKITACNNNTTAGTFPTGYQSVSTPETGQPAYVLASYGDSIVAVNLTTNVAELIY